jgi:hypothetical protein
MADSSLPPGSPRDALTSRSVMKLPLVPSLVFTSRMTTCSYPSRAVLKSAATLSGVFANLSWARYAFSQAANYTHYHRFFARRATTNLIARRIVHLGQALWVIGFCPSFEVEHVRVICGDHSIGLPCGIEGPVDVANVALVEDPIGSRPRDPVVDGVGLALGDAFAVLLGLQPVGTFRLNLASVSRGKIGGHGHAPPGSSPECRSST